MLVAVRGAVERAKREGTPIREDGLRVKSNGGYRDVNVAVMPLTGASLPKGSLLVVFEEPAHFPGGAAAQGKRTRRQRAPVTRKAPSGSCCASRRSWRPRVIISSP